MNVVEVTEKNVREIVEFYKRCKADYFSAINSDGSSFDALCEELMGYESGAISYALVDKGKAYALFTCDKDSAELSNLCIDHSAIDGNTCKKLLEFAIKQFSSITFVFTWVDSLDSRLAETIEDFGFEYTGEQDYIDKERFLSRFRYVYRRKK